MRPVAVVAGDFNGDGKTDLAVANQDLDNVSIFLGDGDGTFQAAVNFGAGDAPTTLLTGDFNGDGKLDLAVANGNSNNVSILLGNGDGTFQAPLNAAVGVEPIALAAADFNGDGKLDLAVANLGVPGLSAGSFSVLIGNGDGTFQPQQDPLTNPGSGGLQRRREGGSGSGKRRQQYDCPAGRQWKRHLSAGGHLRDK
jgi:hypothetical protein